MAANYPEPRKPYASPTYPGCLYCENCNAHYTPNLIWGFIARPIDTEGIRTFGNHQKGTECPFCGHRP